MISLITAYKGDDEDLIDFYKNLEPLLSCKYVYWVVSCCFFSQKFLHIIKNSDFAERIILCAYDDFSLYDALNKAISISPNEWYIVIGVGDIPTEFCKSSISRVITEEAFDFDIACFPVLSKISGLIHPLRDSVFFNVKHHKFFSMHSGGMLIRKSLHNKLGFYSNRYFIAADCHFMLKTIKANVKIKYYDFPLFQYADGGMSSSYRLANIVESTAAFVNVFPDKKLAAYFLMIYRLIRNIRSIWRGKF